MSWDVCLMKAPGDALTLGDVPQGYGYLGTVAHVVARLQSIIPKEWFDNADSANDDTLPVAWFTIEDIWGGVDCDAFGLRIYFHTLEDDRVGRATPVNMTDIVTSVFLAFQPGSDPHHTDPHRDMNHPVWDFIAAACLALECRAEDDTRFLGPDGRPIPLPESRRPWWRFWR
jgi:hypothetical protein